MAAFIYCGEPGSGKSYEAVESVILPAVTPTRKKQLPGLPEIDYSRPEAWTPGRNVTTNLEGLQVKLVREYVAAKIGCPIEIVGQITRVDRDDFNAKGMFPFQTMPKLDEHGKPVLDGDGMAVKICDDRTTRVKAGDLVVIDEAWSLWGTGARLSREAMGFVREHRHFVHPETSVTCDIVLLTQVAGDITKPVRDIVKNTFEMRKHDALGSDKRYVVNVFRGGSTRWKPERTLQKSYDPEVYALYDSYAGGKGEERKVDKRTLLWKSPKVIGTIILLLVGFPFTIWGAFQIIPLLTGGATETEKIVESAEAALPPGTVIGPATSPPPPPPPKESTSWRIAGAITKNGSTSIIMLSRNGQTRRESPSLCVMRGTEPQSCRVDGFIVMPWRFDSPSAPAQPLPATMQPQQAFLPSQGPVPSGEQPTQPQPSPLQQPQQQLQ